MRNEFPRILLVIMLIDVAACLGYYHLSIFLLHSFLHCLLLALLEAIHYFELLLRKRCFVKGEIQSIFDCKVTGHHQRIKFIEKF